MSRRRKGRPVSGWICLDKPVGITSTKAVSKVRWLFGARRAGHAGTLDPLATGVLPIALGEATKTVPVVQEDGRKFYRFEVRWGIETATDDAEGDVVATANARPDPDAIRALLPEFTGDIMQTPPAFSAIKVDGERAYDLARGGEEVVLEPREVTIESLDLVGAPNADTAVFECACGTGTYVRALARDMGRRLDCRGHVTALRRLEVGPFTTDNAITLDQLEAAHEPDDPASLDGFLKPLGFALSDLPEIPVNAGDAAKLGRGQSLLLRGRDAPIMAGRAHATHAGVSVAMGEIEAGTFHPRRVFLTH